MSFCYIRVFKKGCSGGPVALLSNVNPVAKMKLPIYTKWAIRDSSDLTFLVLTVFGSDGIIVHVNCQERNVEEFINLSQSRLSSFLYSRHDY